MNRSISILLLLSIHIVALAQEDKILPPVLPWKGKSIELIAKPGHPWITPAEQSDFVNTPSYAETIAWFTKLCTSSEVLELITVGQSANGRPIIMIIGSQDGAFDKTALQKSSKPLLFVQAGIHAGEIDGKDAGMMLLRDIAFGKKKDLLKNVNILFIPILNVDGHERISAYNRVNQRGPANMGWRTNGRNLNLNRDYMKLDTEEIRAVVGVMNDYNPTLYLDLHVTDGADYQYDITYGYTAYSPAIYKWLNKTLQPAADKGLKDNGHIPGPLMFAVNDRDFAKGNAEFAYSPRFSNTYGDIRRTPSILIENHSLKPFKQRVLGTYVFLESILTVLSTDGASLKKVIQEDRALRNREIILTWNLADKPDSMVLLGVESKIEKSLITNKDFVRWTGKPVTQKIPFVKYNKPGETIKRPTAYWVPATYKNVIDRLALHGIKMEKITDVKTVQVELYRLSNHKFSATPFEGHFTMTAAAKAEKHAEIFYPGSVRISTDQELGDLAIQLLEPISPDSFFAWGFFPEIFNQTEYIEEYAIEPLARLMLAKDEKLRQEFELKKQENSEFLNDPAAVYNWFYTRSPYVDGRYLVYPVGVER